MSGNITFCEPIRTRIVFHGIHLIKSNSDQQSHHQPTHHDSIWWRQTWPDLSARKKLLVCGSCQALIVWDCIRLSRMKTKTCWAECQEQFYSKNSQVSRPYPIIHTQSDIKGHAEKRKLLKQYRNEKQHIFWFRVHLTPIRCLHKKSSCKRQLDGTQWNETAGVSF